MVEIIHTKCAFVNECENKIHKKVDIYIDNIHIIVYNNYCREDDILGKEKEVTPMSNPNMEAKVKELMELKRLKEELEAEIAAAEDAIKAVMGDEELLLAGSYKVSWKTFTSSRLDTTALKKALPEVAATYTKTTTGRRFSVN